MPFASMIEGNFDLRYSPRSRWNLGEMETCRGSCCARRHLPFALQDVNLDTGLAVRSGREDLTLASYGMVVLRGNELRKHTAHASRCRESQRGHVEEQDILDFASEDAGLDGGTDRDDLVRVHALVGSLPKNILHQLLRPAGMRVEPPTRTTSSMPKARQSGIRRCQPGTGFQACAAASSSTSCSNLARLSFNCRCFGSLSAVGGDEREVDLRAR